jgi:hypothetical protein
VSTLTTADEIRALILRAYAHQDRGDQTACETCLTEASQKAGADPDHLGLRILALDGLGALRRDQGRYAEAEEVLRQGWPSATCSATMTPT